MAYLPVNDNLQFFFLSPNQHPSFEHLINITHALIDLYTHAFSRPVQKFLLFFDTLDCLPFTVRENQSIYIHCPNVFDIQFAFQLSHELCHWMIPQDVSSNLRWLEETFAVLASMHFPLCGLDLNTEQYINQTSTISVFYPAKCVSYTCLPNTQMVKYLETDGETFNFTDYGSYSNMALALQPLFNEHPALWQSIPYICDIPKSLDFEKSLDHWLTVCPPSIRDSLIILTDTFKDSLV